MVFVSVFGVGKGISPGLINAGGGGFGGSGAGSRITSCGFGTLSVVAVNGSCR